MLKKTFRAALSLLLVFSLLLGVSANGLVVLAEGNDEASQKGTLNYVSLGDSMTNGYGLEGYNGNTGVEDYGEKSYANQFAEWLKTSGRATEVNHAQLAMSAMRAEDLHWLLEVDCDDPAVEAVINELAASGWNEDLWYSVFTNGDYWTWEELVNDYRLDVAAYCIEGKDNGEKFSDRDAYDEYTDMEALHIVAEYYQTSVKEADIISLGMGNGNFGVFMFGRITDAIGFTGTPDETLVYNIENALRECDEETKAQILSLKAEAEAILAENGIYANDGDDSVYSTMEALYNSFMYAVVSYALNYAGSVEAILQLNPDAEIIQVALMNTMVGEDGAEEGTAGYLMGLLFTPLNTYLAALPTVMQAAGNSVYADATFYWAEADYVHCIVDTYEAPLSGTVRARFVESIVGTAKDPGMIWGLLGMDFVTQAEIEAYEKMNMVEQAQYAAQYADKAAAVAMYLAFENAVIANKHTPVTVESILGLTNIMSSGDELLTALQTAFNAQYPAAITAEMKDAAATVLAALLGQDENMIKVLIGDEDAIKNIACSLYMWGSGTHAGEEEILACERERCGFGCESVRQAYHDMKANPVYGLVAVQSGGMLTVAEIAALHEADFSDAAIYALMAQKSGGMLTAVQVAALDTLGVYGFAAVMIGGGLTAEQVEYAYNYGGLDEEQSEMIYQLHLLYSALQNLKSATPAMNDGIKAAESALSAIDGLCMLQVMPEVMGNVIANSQLSGLLALFGRCVIGNGIGSHPSETGHNTLAEAVITAYSKEYTANQKTLETVLYLINEYYDDAYAYAYQYALANGYIDEAIASIDGIIAEIQAIDLNKVEMTDAFRAEVAAEAAEIIETLEAAKALLLEADVLDQASLDALLALLNEAAEDILHLEHLLVQAGVDVNQLVIIPVLKATHAELVDVIIPKILSDLEDAVEAGTAYLMEMLGETYDILVDALMTHISEKVPEIDEWIYNWLYNNPEKVIAFFNEYGDDIVDLMEEYGDEILTALGVVLYLYGEDIVTYLIENRVDLLQNLAKWVSVYGEKIVMMLQVYAEATGLCDLVRGEIATLEAMLAELESELAEQMNLLNNVLMAQLAELEAELARLQAELESAVEAQKPVIEAAIAEVEKQIAELKAMIEEVKAVIAEIQAKIDEIVAMLPALNEKLNALINSLLDLDAALEYLMNAGIELGTPVVQNALNAVANAVAELAGIASENAAAELAKLIEQAKAVLDKAYYDATHTDYHVKPGTSHYVGLGDDMSVASSYVELLAKELGVNFTNMAAAGMSMTDLLYILDENFVADEYTLATFGGDVVALREAIIAELKKADLVTVGVGSFGITDFVSAQAEGALAQILNEQLGAWLEWEFNGTRPIYDEMSKFVDLSATTYSMDWVSYLGEEGTAKLYEMLAEVRADLIEKGVPVVYTYDIGLVINDTMDFPVDIFAAGEIVIDIPVADLMTMMVESYMYAYVTHLSNAGEVFNKIHEIAPGAELLVIGMFNPMDEIVLNLAGTTIALGDYYDYLVDAMNLHYLGYAFVTPNTTFVSVPDAQSMIDVYVDQFENVEDMLMALALGSIESNVDLTEAGQVYVKDQIMNALNVTRGILGDVNDDGYVNSIDAMLIAQYDAWIIGADALNMSVADVNGDGYVNSIDAMLIAQYDAWIIDKFPVEQ